MTVGPYRLEVSYTGQRDRDDAIRKAVGKDKWASGAGFGARDMSFAFMTPERLAAAKRRLEKASIPGVVIHQK